MNVNEATESSAANEVDDLIIANDLQNNAILRCDTEEERFEST